MYLQERGKMKKTIIGMALAAAGAGDACYSLEGPGCPPIDPEGTPPGMRCLLTLDGAHQCASTAAHAPMGCCH